MNKTTTKKPCGNPACSTSTGICGNITFGSGELDDYGYWEIPCETCSEHYDFSEPWDSHTHMDNELDQPFSSGEEFFNYCKSVSEINERISRFGTVLLNNFPLQVCAGVSVLSNRGLMTYEKVNEVWLFKYFLTIVEEVMEKNGWEITIFPDEIE